MNTQNTPVHIHLWHRDFWLLVVANLLLSMSVTMLIPTLPLWMLYMEGLTSAETGLAMGVFALGLFLPGVFCSFLVQHYRRNMVCTWSIMALAVSLLVPLYIHPMPFWMVMLMRLVQGSAYGLAQMVLASTLVIDTCESYQRTEANHSSTWFGRMALSLGPMIGLLLYHQTELSIMLYAAAGCCLLAVLLIFIVHFPFRVPSEHVTLFSLDRFFLTSGWPLFLNLFLIMVGVGMILSLPLEELFYGLMMVGFLLALLAQRFVFPNAELKSEVVAGLIVIIAAELILLFVPQSPLHFPLLGLGLGILGARFVLFFIKLSRHCQRGTAQSSYLLGWESGLAVGIGMGYFVFDCDRDAILKTSLALVVAGLAIYTLFMHHWFLKNKNR